MTLPSSGSISTAQIQAEIGDTGTITIPDANTRTLTGKSTGALVIPTDFYGKTWGGGGGGAYIPAAGSYTYEDWDSVSTTITGPGTSVTWTWSASPDGVTATHASGASGTDITFTYTPSMGKTIQSKTTVISLSSGGNSWTLTMIADNSNFSPGQTMSL